MCLQGLQLIASTGLDLHNGTDLNHTSVLSLLCLQGLKLIASTGLDRSTAIRNDLTAILSTPTPPQTSTSAAHNSDSEADDSASNASSADATSVSGTPGVSETADGVSSSGVVNTAEQGSDASSAPRVVPQPGMKPMTHVEQLHRLVSEEDSEQCYDVMHA